jgi:hypothetical protein
MFLVGNNNGWSLTNTPMTRIANYTWQVTTTFTAANTQFKFVPKDWTLSYGDVDANGVADSSGGGNIKVPLAGTYRITFNDLTRVYTVQAQ